MQLPFHISDAALEEITQIIKTKNIPLTMGLRVGVNGNACSGSKQFFLGFDVSKSDDVAFSLPELIIFVQKKHLLYVAGVNIDFTDTSQGRGFTFTE